MTVPNLRLPPGSTIMVLGSGPIIIGQACEFDYSGTQACKALKDLGFRVVLINSNPATIMTDESVADATYVEPLTVDFARQVIEREKPAAILPTVGGQVGLNLALDLANAGVLEQHGVQLIGADPAAIELAEDRQLFKDAMVEIGVGVAKSGIAHTMDEAEAVLAQVGLPAIIRPSFTLGGAGGGVAWNIEEFRDIVANGLDLSPTTQVLVEQSLLGWKEYEYEVMRDLNDNVIVICTIENFDPMGIHTGDSITVAPAQTLTDREYQHLRDLCHPHHPAGGGRDGRQQRPVRGQPRERRGHRLHRAQPAGEPQLGAGVQGHGLPHRQDRGPARGRAAPWTRSTNDITQQTPASFEPALDYVITKIPRWNFEKFDVTRTGPSAPPCARSARSWASVGTFVESHAQGHRRASRAGGPTSADLGRPDELQARPSPSPTPDRLACHRRGAQRRGWDRGRAASTRSPASTRGSCGSCRAWSPTTRSTCSRDACIATHHRATSCSRPSRWA